MATILRFHSRFLSGERGITEPRGESEGAAGRGACEEEGIGAPRWIGGNASCWSSGDDVVLLLVSSFDLMELILIFQLMLKLGLQLGN